MEVRTKIMGRMLARVIVVSLLYLFILVTIMFLGYRAGHARIWTGTEDDYLFWHWISEHMLGVGWFLFSMGELLILLYYYWKMCDFFQKVSKGMEDIYSENSSWITLPSELKETEHQMNSLHQQVRQSRQQAKEAEQRKNDLVVYLAHDLKTPLTSVLGYLTLLAETSDLPTEMREKYVGITLKKAERLEELINEFFEITRFNLTSLELEIQSISFNRLLEQTIFEFQPMLREKNMTCKLLAKGDVMVACDLNKMQRVVDNLLRNGILYGYEDSEISVVLEEETESVILTCTNHGPTIPEEKLERIFEQFYRLDSARTSSNGGAGLGLAIAREILRVHGGAITAESRDEVTCFRVTLPKNS